LVFIWLLRSACLSSGCMSPTAATASSLSPS
jgi:hypothetical protein